jgi:hypothetical protein
VWIEACGIGMFVVRGLARIEFLGHRRYPGNVERSAVQPKLKEGCNKRFTGIGAVLARFARLMAGPHSRLASCDRQLLPGVQEQFRSC